MPERECVRPVIPLTLCLLMGILAGDSFAGYLLLVQTTITLLLFALGLWLWLSISNPPKTLPHLVTVGLGLLFFCLGYLLIQPWRVERTGERDLRSWVDGPVIQIQGTITGAVQKDAYGLRFDMLSVQIQDAQGGWRSVWGGVRVRTRQALVIERGDRIRTQGKLKSVRGMQNPGGFDYARYLADRNLLARMRLSPSTAVEIRKSTLQKSFVSQLNLYRHQVQSLLAQHLDPQARGVLQALVTGDRELIAPRLQAAFRHAGVAHLLAISGLHIGIVGTLMFGASLFVLRRVPFLLSRGWTTKGAALVTLGPIWLYGLMSGMAPSTLRAVLMASILLAAILMGQRPDTFNTLAVAAMAIVCLHPPALFAVSFQLSFVAVFWLLVGMKRKNETSDDLPQAPVIMGHKINRWMINLLWVSVLAWGGTLPLVMRYFNILVWASVPVNLLVVPVISLWVVPLGLLGAFFSGWWPDAAVLMFKASALGLTPALAWVSGAAALPFAWIYTFTPSLLEVCLYYLVLYGVLQWLPWPGTSSKGKIKGRVPVWSVVLVVGMICLDAGYWCYQRWWRNDLRVTVLDVGQGTASVVAFPKGPVWLIDGGGFSNNKVFDIGHRIVAPFLWRQKICRVDRVILSHPNSDHLNGLLFVLRHFKVDTFWSNGQSSDTAGYRELRRLLVDQGINAPPFPRIPRLTTVNGVAVAVMFPAVQDLQDFSEEALNRNSLTLRIAHQGHSILFTGDLTRPGERLLADRHSKDLPSDLLMVPHHGSRTSSSWQFIKSVQPRHALITCGWRNRFGFPHKTVLERYQKIGADLWRTDHHGALMATATRDGWKIQPTVDWQATGQGGDR